jgi:hypothetical protein
MPDVRLIVLPLIMDARVKPGHDAEFFCPDLHEFTCQPAKRLGLSAPSLPGLTLHQLVQNSGKPEFWCNPCGRAAMRD